MQRDVAFYAEQLCISTRYLSAITKEVGQISAKEIIDEFLTLEIKVALQSTNLSLKEPTGIIFPTSRSSDGTSRSIRECHRKNTEQKEYNR